MNTVIATAPAVRRTTRRVTGIEALNQLGKNHVNALSRDLERIKTRLDNATTPRQRRSAKVAMYINYTMTGVMGLPALFLVGLVVKDLLF